VPSDDEVASASELEFSDADGWVVVELLCSLSSPPPKQATNKTRISTTITAILTHPPFVFAPSGAGSPQFGQNFPVYFWPQFGHFSFAIWHPSFSSIE
jgi:hypothetical protein